MGCGILAGISYGFYPHPLCDLAGFALMLAWHVMDGADGQLARLTRTYSELGKVLDGICDYVTFAAVYIGLGSVSMSAMASGGAWIWPLVALTGICQAVQSAAYELQRQNYNYWGWQRQSAALPAMGRLQPGLAWRPRIAAQMNRLYTFVAALGGWRCGVVQCGSSPPFSHRARPINRHCARPIARISHLSSAAGACSAPITATLGVFIAAMLNLPLWYFLFEIIGLSLALIVLLARLKGQNAAFLQLLGQEDAWRQPAMPALKQPGA